MPRYFFQLLECGTIFDDPEGQELTDLPAAHAVALTAARGMMSEEIRHGTLCLSCVIVILDDRGHELERVAFRDAVSVQGG